MQVPITYIIGEQNGVQVKIPYEEFTQTFVNYVPEPNSPITEGGQQGYISADDWDNTGEVDYKSSGYIYSNNAWRRIPTYTQYWEDLDPEIHTDGTISYLRFLPIHKTVELSTSQKDLVKETLGLTVASASSLGLVRIIPTPVADYGIVSINSDGGLYVNKASNAYPGVIITEGDGDVVYTKAAIDAKINPDGSYNIEPATETKIGGILGKGTSYEVNETGTLLINNASVQQTPNYGLMQYAPSTFVTDLVNDTLTLDETQYTLTLSQSRVLIEHCINQQIPSFEIPTASETVLGGVRVDSVDSSILINSSGTIDVKPATDTTKGAVTILHNIDDAVEQAGVNVTYTVPTAYAVKTAIESIGTTYPIATSDTLGCIMVGQGLQIDSSGKLAANISLASTANNQPGLVYITNMVQENSNYVPTSNAVHNFVESKISEISITQTVPPATSETPGLVYVQPAVNDNTTNSHYFVPTVQKVADMLASQQSDQLKIPSQNVLSSQWLIIGTGTIAKDEFITAATAAGYTTLKIITSDSISESLTFPLVQMGAIVVFNQDLSADQVSGILSNMHLSSGTTETECQNNFILLPGAGLYGNYLTNVN